MSTEHNAAPPLPDELRDASNWYRQLASEGLARLNLSSSKLFTITVACQQSPTVVAQQLIESGLPKLMASAVLEFCQRATTFEIGSSYPMVSIAKVTELLEFFADLCSVGLLRDWLGLAGEGAIFWEPLLTVLCDDKLGRGTATALLENSTIKFLSKVTACHAKNQQVLVVAMISVLRSGVALATYNCRMTSRVKSSIAGFMRRLVVEILLEGEKLTVLIQSDRPMRDKKESAAESNSVQMYLSVNTKCGDILDRLETKFDEPRIVHRAIPDEAITGETTIALLLAKLSARGLSLSTLTITLNVTEADTKLDENPYADDRSESPASTPSPLPEDIDLVQLPTPLQVFASRGGLSLLALNLPKNYPELPNSTPKAKAILKNSLAACAVFLKLPDYAQMLLRDKIRAQCLLRLIFGETGDGEGNEIVKLPLLSSLPVVSFETLRQLLEDTPYTTEDGVRLWRLVIEVGAFHQVLDCLSIFSHHEPNGETSTASVAQGGKTYWPKGTGYGTGCEKSSWNYEQTQKHQKHEEELVIVLLKVLSMYINPADMIPSQLELSYAQCGEMLPELPPILLFLLLQSSLIPILNSYLRNDSVLDITLHIPLYQAILWLIRGVSLSRQLVPLLEDKSNAGGTTIATLLANMKACVELYVNNLKLDRKTAATTSKAKLDAEDEVLVVLFSDIKETLKLVQEATRVEGGEAEKKQSVQGSSSPVASAVSVEDQYLELMKPLQFGSYDMIGEDGTFVISHHYGTKARYSGTRATPRQVKRLAQETVTLSTSLPLSFSSSVFVRTDTDRLDVMKVMITGPADTPYANGCFEFDVFFPSGYPNVPMSVNLQTTGKGKVRFNPNLYQDGKVCLSVLNTWAGRPEEKWNAETSSFLQVLVSIQSLILVPEPYFNEPGFEQRRGSPSGTQASVEYNRNIRLATVQHAMIDQIRSPCPCFKEIIHAHFYLKRDEIRVQVDKWLSESNSRAALQQPCRVLLEELAKLQPPAAKPSEPPVVDVAAVAGPSSLTVPPPSPSPPPPPVEPVSTTTSMEPNSEEPGLDWEDFADSDDGEGEGEGSEELSEPDEEDFDC
uniref:Baculoviral IAP repeat-containing protein 6 n=1 Tax=Culex pipiens TaxID=7175 RepID=A0A8D8CH63_CULPI